MIAFLWVTLHSLVTNVPEELHWDYSRGEKPSAWLNRNTSFCRVGKMARILFRTTTKINETRDVLNRAKT